MGKQHGVCTTTMLPHLTERTFQHGSSGICKGRLTSPKGSSVCKVVRQFGSPLIFNERDTWILQMTLFAKQMDKTINMYTHKPVHLKKQALHPQQVRLHHTRNHHPPQAHPSHWEKAHLSCTHKTDRCSLETHQYNLHAALGWQAQALTVSLPVPLPACQIQTMAQPSPSQKQHLGRHHSAECEPIQPWVGLCQRNREDRVYPHQIAWAEGPQRHLSLELDGLRWGRSPKLVILSPVCKQHPCWACKSYRCLSPIPNQFNLTS